MNSEESSKTDCTSFEYTFGSTDFKHFILPGQLQNATSHPKYLQLLNDDLQSIRMEAHRVQEAEQAKRRLHTGLNTYVVGDYILFDETTRGILHDKLNSRYSGPYIVTGVHKLDISCKHIVTSKMKTFHMNDIKMFIGSREEA